MLVGALLAGSVGDILGRRKVMLISYAWFSVGMGLTAMTTTSSMFGWLRFFTGLGVGALVATTAALVSEYAPKGKKNLINAITYGGVPLGSLLAALLAMFLLPSIGWRGLFWIGALPMVTLLPLAYFKMPESVAWLASRGRLQEARALSGRTGVEIPAAEATPSGQAVPVTEGKAGYAGLFSRTYVFPTVILGLMSATGLVLVYSLNTWLPELMLRAGFNVKGSLSLLLCRAAWQRRNSCVRKACKFFRTCLKASPCAFPHFPPRRLALRRTLVCPLPESTGHQLRGAG